MNRKPNDSMRLIIVTFVGVFLGFFIGISFPTLSLTKVDVEVLMLGQNFFFPLH